MDQRETESSSSTIDLSELTHVGSAPAKKRQRLSDALTSPSLQIDHIPATISVCPETVHGGSLPPTEEIGASSEIRDPADIDARLDEIRKQKDNIHEEEKRLLEERDAASRHTIKELKSRLAEALKDAEKARRAQAAGDAQLSRQKAEMEQKITELVNKNVKLEELMAQRTAEGTTKLNAAASRITELRQKFLRASSPSQRDLFLKTSELQEAKMNIQELETEKISLRKQIQDLRPKAAYADELEKKLKYANSIISNLRRNDPKNIVPDNEPSFYHVEVEDVINVEEDVMDITYEKLGSKGYQDRAINDNSILRGAILNGMTRVAPEHEIVDLLSESQAVANDTSGTEHIEEIPIEVSDGEESSSSLQFYEDNGSAPVEEQSQVDHRIFVGQLYVLPSDLKFFEINWAAQYKRHGRGFICKNCPKKELARGHMEDHIWGSHYGGFFMCPLCPASTFTTKVRYSIKKHMRDVHLPK